MSDEAVTTTVSDEEVNSTRQRVEELRSELDAVNDELAQSEASRANAVRKERLDREAESLEQQLQSARQRLEVSQTEGAANTTDETSGESPAIVPDDTPETDDFASQVDFPISLGSDRYQLSDGSVVYGEDEANQAQQALNGQSAATTSTEQER